MRDGIGIALYEANGGRRDAKPLGRDLAEGGFVTLPMRMRADPEHQAGRSVQARAGMLLEGCIGWAAGDLDREGKADATKAAVPGGSSR